MEGSFEDKKKIIIDVLGDKRYVPMKAKELAMVLNVTKERREEFRQVLGSLVKEEKISINKKGKYKLKEAAGERLTGIYRASAKGFGFVILDDSEDPDVFISEEENKGAMDGDKVEIVIVSEPQGRSKEGAIVRIVERANTEVVGLFCRHGKQKYGFVIPDNQRFNKDIFIPEEGVRGAVDGHKVVAKLTSYGDNEKKAEGKVVQILGHENDPGVDILSIVLSHNLPTEFGERVLNQAERVSKPVSEADMAGRRDMRSWQCVTIDGEDAKDLDDAITLTKEGENYLLGVHIADVTNYVQEKSALGQEAYKRGTSVYLVDRVIPMLPHTLSNGICSLNQGEDRLCLCCLMTVNEKGEVISHEIVEGIINVDQRMTYTAVASILSDAEAEERQTYKELVPMFERMGELSKILRSRRKKRGSIDFDFPESKIILDEKGKVTEIKPYDRNVATKIIEDFMLLANETVAENFFWQELPFVYRNHEVPDEEKMQTLATFIHNFGYSMHLGQNSVKPKEVQKLLANFEGKDEEALISRLALRSMKQARYSSENSGHFGLAASYYTHFTSPIRRYPDLQIHRIIKDTLRGRMSNERIAHYQKILPEVTRHCSEMERRAEEAERDTIKLKKVEYMSGYLGKTFTGVISGITKWGMYVELPNTIEGLVHVTNMSDDHYDYYEDRYEMVGEHTGRSYKLGQNVMVKVLSTDSLQRTIDFKLVKEKEKNGKNDNEDDCQ
ncbi:ribonuclease R [Ohessyouella blattaphilus]|uniref:Ribonuclease R n=1 Tax=Ohessyouella blattaphilus TaxID=2949333 RepID=A0ABT1EIZ7_9FIRM|nr:ribonuclease R [Ohessyouella blattaphilus]MCP1110678.1 ribonuclease R [Ohessyouella blattaphilus]MCR8564072.1 ribonuclease R [Ohessyouella blattaphilus]